MFSGVRFVVRKSRLSGPLSERNRMSVFSGAVARVVGIEVGVVSGVINLESSGAGTPDKETTP
jgi:hypothetical protein